jgi:hypothetical protein
MRRHRPSFWTRIKALLWRVFGPPSGGASDPLIGVRQPVRRGPSGRRAAAAVEEPDHEGENVEAVGRRHRAS